MKMAWGTTMAISCCLLAACHPASNQPASSPPVVAQEVAPSNEKARDLLRAWGAHDDAEVSQGQLKRVLADNELMFGKEGALPECKLLLDNARELEVSPTFYGLSLVPKLYQKATGMGCDVDVNDLPESMQSHIETLAKKSEIELGKGESILVAKWVSTQAVRDQNSCVHRTMAQARKNGLDMAKGMSEVRGKCARPE